MVQPPRPWPRPSPYDDVLSELVASGDIAKVRDHFDSIFWEGSKERPGWNHLRIALMREDRPMIRLLHTWGAMPDKDDMAKFAAIARDKYPDYVRLLRAAGLRPENASWEELPDLAARPTHKEIKARAEQIYLDSGRREGRDLENWLQAEAELTAAKKAAFEKAAGEEAALFSEVAFRKNAADMLEKVPGEWRLVVKAFHASGANEAVIAGGALRDLFNERQIKDVDIFLRSRGSERKNKKFLKQVFAAAELDLHDQKVGYDSYRGAIIDKFSGPRVTSDADFGEGPLRRERGMEAWTLVAGPSKTEYNVIFIDDALDKKLAAEASPREQRALFAGNVLDSFDIGLCQIACDGNDVVSTPAYRDDVKNQRVSLLRPNAGTEDHLKRVTAKYQDWQPNAEAKKALAPKPPAPPRNRSTWY